MAYNAENPPTLLKLGDDVYFKSLKYTVFDAFLAHYVERQDYYDNDLIFEKLHLDQGIFLKKVYGYNSADGDWRQSHDDDFGALTRASWILLTYDLEPSRLKDSSQLINPLAVLEDLKKYEAAPKNWKDLSEWLPLLVSLLTGFNLLNLSSKEILEVLNG